MHKRPRADRPNLAAGRESGEREIGSERIVELRGLDIRLAIQRRPTPEARDHEAARRRCIALLLLLLREGRGLEYHLAPRIVARKDVQLESRSRQQLRVRTHY